MWYEAIVQCNGPALRPLLQNAHAEGGYWGACPVANEIETELQAKQSLAISRELNERLLREFHLATWFKRDLTSLRAFSNNGSQC
jgi:hypothetical protein